MKMVQIKGFEESERNVSLGNHTRRTDPQRSPQLLHKCDVTLTDKQIIREWGEEGLRKGMKEGITRNEMFIKLSEEVCGADAGLKIIR